MHTGLVTRTVLAGLVFAGCGVNPPAEIHGARGYLDAYDPYCFIYPDDRYANVQLDDNATFTVSLPAGAGSWGRGLASYSELDDDSCGYGVGGGGVRVQYGADLVGDPDCERCSTRYRALFVEGLRFEPAYACAAGFGCDSSVCRTTAAASADAFAIWCDSPDEFGL